LAFKALLPILAKPHIYQMFKKRYQEKYSNSLCQHAENRKQLAIKKKK